MSLLRRRRTWRRWLLLSAGLVVLAGVVVWQASGFVVARLLEKQLRDGGWPDARVEGGALALPDVVFDLVRFTGDERLVAEDVRARLGPGIDRIAIGRVGADVEISADGAWNLPGAGRSSGEGSLIDALPVDGIAIDRVDMRAATPFGLARITASDVVVQRLGDRAEVRLSVDDGEYAAGGVRIAGLGGDATAVLAPGEPVSIEVHAEAEAVRVAGIDLGSVAVTGAWRDGRAQLAMTTPTPELAEIAVDAEAALTTDSRAAKLSGRVLLLASSPAQGLVTFDLDLESARPASAGEEPVRGRLRVDGSGLAYPGLFTAGALALSADVQGTADELRIAIGESRAELTPSPGLVPDEARALDGVPLSVELAAAEGRAPTLAWSLVERSAVLAGRVAASAGDARVAATVNAEADLAAAPGNGAAAGFGVRAEVDELTARSLPWGGLVLGAEDFDGTIEHRADEWRMEGAGTFTAAGEVASVRLDGATAAWTGTLAGNRERVVLAARDCIEWSFESLEVDAARLVDVAPLCIDAGDDDVVLTYTPAEDRTSFALSIEEQPLDARLETAEAAYALAGRWPALTVTGATNASGIADLLARVSGGAITSAEAELAVSGLEGSAELRNDAVESIALRVVRIESLASPAPIAPVGLELAAERDGAALSFDAVASDDLGTFVLEAAGRYEGPRATAAVRLHPVRFVRGATEIRDVSPLLAEHIVDASGQIAFEGEVEWAESALDGSGTLTAQGFGATIAGVPVAGIGTEIRFTSLMPPVTAQAQTVTIERVDLGVPLEHGTAVLDLAADGALAFRSIEFEFAGGRLFAEPFTVDSGVAEDIGFVLRAEDVELSHFLALSRIDGLAGTGVLSGRVPVRLVEGGIRLDDGVLAAETDGVLRYTPSDLPDFLAGDDVRSRMLREVLTNFEYEELSVAVSGESGQGGEQRLTLSARGANPDFLEGHPIELSFNFTGPLLGAVRSAVDLTGAAELEQIFEQRETENEENSR